MSSEQRQADNLEETGPKKHRVLFARLKGETQQTHRELESQLGLLDRPFEMVQYRRLLELFYGFYLPWEDRVYGKVKAFLPGREKLPFLEQDLRTLGSDIHQLPTCSYISEPANESEAYGSMYVIEGSTLGGQLISRHLEQSPGFAESRASRFFRSYGSETGRQWKSFQATVLARTAETDDQVVIAAANETFQVLKRWLRQTEALLS